MITFGGSRCNAGCVLEIRLDYLILLQIIHQCLVGSKQGPRAGPIRGFVVLVRVQERALAADRLVGEGPVFQLQLGVRPVGAEDPLEVLQELGQELQLGRRHGLLLRGHRAPFMWIESLGAGSSSCSIADLAPLSILRRCSGSAISRRRSKHKPRQNFRHICGWLGRPDTEPRPCCRVPEMSRIGADVGTLTGREWARASLRGSKTHE